MSAYAHYRIKPEVGSLKEKDYRFGWGMNNSLYFRIDEARKRYNEANPDKKLPVREDFKETYDVREGYYITGEKINTRHHPLHDKILVEKKTGKRYCIDTVTIQHYFGKLMTLCIRQEGTKSHGVRDWEAITCKDPDTIKRIKEHRENYELIDK